MITKLELGGAQTQALSVLRNLDRAAYEPFLFTCAEGMLTREAASIPGLRLCVSRFLDRPLHPFKDLLAFCELVAFMRRERVDVVHTHSSKAGILGRFAARLAGCRRIVHTVHGWSFNDFQCPPLRWLYIFLERLAACCCDFLAVVSEHDRCTGLALGIGRPQQYCLVNYGIDCASFRPKQHQTAADGPVIGMTACLKPQKSPDDFIHAASLLAGSFPGARFVIAGDGMLRPQLERLLDEKGLRTRVDLPGWQRDIPAFLSGLDVFVLTSLWEGMPVSVLEAMAAGLPVVVTDTGGVREVVSDGANGFIVGRRDVPGLVKRIACLCADAGLRRQMGAAGRQKVSRGFDVAAMAAGYENLYRGG